MKPLTAVALMGATGTGKSALAMQLATEAQTSIICCDSMQLYQGLDIGTAKPGREERQRVAHFLVDCCKLPDQYSAARWSEEAREVIAAENEQGRTPLIVGGTGLYLKALISGFAAIPAEDPQVRQRLEQLQKEAGTAVLYQMLQHKDPDMAARLKTNDTQRIIRALSVYQSSGHTLSSWQQREPEVPAIQCPLFVLDVEREILRERLAERFHTMMEQGWLDEVSWLAGLNLADTHPAMRAVGYRQLLDHLLGRLSLEQAVKDGITATRRYAKRQRTWFAHQTKDATHGSAEELKELLGVVCNDRT